MDSIEIHNVLTAKAALDSEICRLTDAFNDEFAAKLDRIIDGFEKLTNEEFHIRYVHRQLPRPNRKYGYRFDSRSNLVA